MRRKIIFASIILLSLVFFAMTVGVTLNKDPAAELQQAKSHYQNGEYQKAEQSYQNILNQYPDSDYAFQAQKGLTMVYIATNKPEQAEAGYEKLLSDFSTNAQIAEAVYEIAETYRHHAKFELSSQVCQDILDIWPSSEQAIWAQRGLVISSIALDKMEAAQVAVDKLLTDFSENANIAEAVFNVADTYYWFNYYEKANQIYQYVLDNWPNAEHAMWAQMGLAISNIADGNDAAAEIAVDNLVANFVGNERLPEALLHIAGRYGWDGKYQQAENVYQQIIQNHPDNPFVINAQFELARIDTSLKDYDLAVDTYGRLVNMSESEEEKVKYQAWKSMAYHAKGDLHQATIEAKKAIINYPDQPLLDRCHYMVAFCHYQEGRYKEAISEYKLILEKYPDSSILPDTQMQIGRCLFFLNKYKEAVDEFQKVVNINPADKLGLEAQKNIDDIKGLFLKKG